MYRANRELTGEQAAARISAYVYGNIIVFATMVPLAGPDAAHGHGLQVVSGVAVSTFLAHVFADLVGHQAHGAAPLTRAEVRQELRNSGPVGTSALVPCLALAAAWAGWLSGPAAIVVAEVYLLARIALVGLAVERLRATRPSLWMLLAGPVLAAVAAAIAVLKVVLSH